MQAVYVPADDLTDPAVAQTFAHLDASIVLRPVDGRPRAVSRRSIRSAPTSRLLDPSHLGERHYRVALRVRETIARYRELEDIIAMLGMEELSADDQRIVRRPAGWSGS